MKIKQISIAVFFSVSLVAEPGKLGKVLKRFGKGIKHFFNGVHESGIKGLRDGVQQDIKNIEKEKKNLEKERLSLQRKYGLLKGAFGKCRRQIDGEVHSEESLPYGSCVPFGTDCVDRLLKNRKKERIAFLDMRIDQCNRLIKNYKKLFIILQANILKDNVWLNKFLFIIPVLCVDEEIGSQYDFDTDLGKIVLFRSEHGLIYSFHREADHKTYDFLFQCSVEQACVGYEYLFEVLDSIERSMTYWGKKDGFMWWKGRLKKSVYINKKEGVFADVDVDIAITCLDHYDGSLKRDFNHLLPLRFPLRAPLFVKCKQGVFRRGFEPSTVRGGSISTMSASTMSGSDLGSNEWATPESALSSMGASSCRKKRLYPLSNNTLSQVYM